ncbi:hypothetical protein HPB51_029046 [Rhipicephalus microplus]|uniref:Uncharacterized protein n=1 Tax=Rhipicephalus microplus TaxID=6941 RepID=A0A9J6CVM8_RHIMP|nr:hypothetical protein HPB51_029046 [Rhipicephalus microplus]
MQTCCPSCGNSPMTFLGSIKCTANIFPPLPAFLHHLRNDELWDDALRDGPPERSLYCLLELGPATATDGGTKRTIRGSDATGEKSGDIRQSHLSASAHVPLLWLPPRLVLLTLCALVKGCGAWIGIITRLRRASRHRHPGYADTIWAPVRPQAGPPGPFKSTKRRGAALTLTRHACTSTMQSPAQHSTPTTTDALSVSPASIGRTADTAVPPLSTTGNVTSPAPTTIQQQAAFLNRAHGPATCNAGWRLCYSQLDSHANAGAREPVIQRWRCNQPRLLLSLPYLRLAYSLEIPSLSTSAFRRASFLPSPKFCLPLLQLTTYRRKWSSRHRRSTEDNTPSPEGSWNTVSANRKPASTARPHSELITVGIQLPPGTLTPKLPLMTCFLPS